MSPVVIGLVLVGLGLVGPPTLPPVPERASPAVEEPTARVIIRCDPADFAVLSAELAARWPDAELLEYGTAAFDRVAGHPFVYLEVSGERLADAPQQLTLITSDGRAYLRSVNPRDAERARMLAIAGANLLAAVADEDVPPDREQAVVPVPTGKPPAAVPQATTAAPTATTTTPTPPLPRTEPTVERRAPPPSRRAPTGWQLALDPGAAMVIGLGPSGRPSTPSFGGALHLDVRAPIGLVFGAGVRVLSEVAKGERLVRVRVTPSVGYIGDVGARRRLEWLVAVGPSFEPWRVLGDDGLRELGSFDGTGYSMLYGAAVLAAFGYRVPLPAAQPLALRVGARAELGASAMGSGNAARVRRLSDEEHLFALGGVELGLGLDVALWFDLAPARRH